MDELAYISARQRLFDSVKNIFELTVKQNSRLPPAESNDIFGLISALWKNLGKTDIYTILPEDFFFFSGIPTSECVHSFMLKLRETSDPSESRSRQDLKFLVNISVIALRCRTSLDIFRGLKFA